MMDPVDDLSPYRADGKLYGFVCVVTGASQPVGQAVIHELAAHGAASIYACGKAASSDSYKDLVESVAKDFPKTKVIPYPYNVAHEDETLALIDELLNSFGRLDVWVCSSGLLGPPAIADTTPADLQRCFDAHSLAPFFALKHAPHAMAKLTAKQGYANASPKSHGFGSIIVIGSVASTRGFWGPAYSMACHASLGVVRAGVPILKGTGVRINYISPGQIDVGVDFSSVDIRGQSLDFPPTASQSKDNQKRFIGLERSGQPQEVAKVAGFLASNFSSYVTGANLVVDGGMSMLNPIMVPI